jgi:PilZ domain-containing protein
MARPERRRYARRKETYKLWCALGAKWVSAFGVDISASGLGIVVPAEIGREEAEFRTMLEERAFVFRAKPVWNQSGTFRGQFVRRYGLKITGIAADDWDALVRYCKGEPVAQNNKAQDELQLVRLQPDDVARLVPLRLQNRLLKMLVERKRLAPLDQKIPLVQYSYGGRVEREGARLHRLLIHSRIFDEAISESRAFDTQFLFSDDASIVTIDE